MAQKNDNRQGNRSWINALKSRLGRYLVLVLVSAWMFVLGVLVGRGTAPVRFDLGELDAELAALKAQEQQQQMARVKIDPQDADPKTDLEFYEELKKSPKQPALKARQPADKPAAPARQEADKPPEKASRPAAAKPAKTEPEPKASEPAASKSPPAGADDPAGTLTVQAASLKDPQDADELVARLKKKGYPAYKTVAVVPEQGIWFRVRVGWFGSREEADDTLKRLKKDGFDPFVVNTKE